MGRAVAQYSEAALAYCHAVVNGERSANRWVKAACQRQLDDLENPPTGYQFEPQLGARVCTFIELLPHIKGEWAREGRAIELEPWQIFILMTVFGWVDSRGLRRFKTVYTEVPRKNAKSTLTSGVGLYLLSADGEAGPEVYSAATTRDQARIVWQDAKRMVEKTAGLQRKFGVKTSAHTIYTPEQSGVFKPLARDQGGNLDGLNVHGGLIDELHGHKTRDIWDVIETGTGARSQPLLWAITTAGFNRSGICYEQRAYTIKILQGVHEDPEYFGIVYGLDDEDDLDSALTDPLLWEKANPNWGVSVNPEDIARKARKAREMMAARNNFLTKHLNVWVNADTAWMDMVAWDKCADLSLRIEDFADVECVAAADLASKIDIASVAYLFERDGHYYAFVRHYLNEDAAESDRNSQYSGWARAGHLTLTPGNVTDYGMIEDDLRQSAQELHIRELGLDPWQAEHMRQRLAEDGMNTVEMRQTVQNMSLPMKELQALVMSGKFHHNGDPVLTWMISNVVCHVDAKDNIYPRKEFPENKIDGAVALIMALGRALVSEESNVIDYQGLAVA